MSLKAALSVSATVSTIAQFLTGLAICSRVRRQGEVGEVSGLPFVAGCLGCAIWLRYSVWIDDMTMAAVNSTGLVLQLAYVLYYYQFCRGAKSLSSVRRQLGGAGLALLLVHVFVGQAAGDPPQQLQRLGMVGVLASVGFTAAPLASLREVFRSRCTASLPLPMITATFLVMLQWYAYGCLIEDQFVQLPNLIGTFLSGFQLFLFVVFPRQKAPPAAASIQI